MIYDRPTVWFYVYGRHSGYGYSRLVVDKMNSLQDFLGKDWVIYESCDPITYGRGFHIRTFIEAQDVSYKGVAEALGDAFEKCPVVIAQHEALKCEVERLKAEVKRLEQYEIYYEMHKGLIWK